MTIDEVMEWVGQSWILLTGAVAVVGVLISFIKQLKEIKAAMLKPITDIQNKLDSLDSKQEMQNRAVLTLQRRSLLDSCERLLKQGYADLKDKEVIESTVSRFTFLNMIQSAAGVDIESFGKYLDVIRQTSALVKTYRVCKNLEDICHHQIFRQIPRNGQIRSKKRHNTSRTRMFTCCRSGNDPGEIKGLCHRQKSLKNI